MRRFSILLLVLMTAFASSLVWAQGSAESSVRGNLAGSVVDPSGAVVSGSKVTITGPTGTKSDTTNQDGQFLFPLLTPGFYSVKVEKGSFKTADIKGVEVVTGKTSNIRVGMVAGQQTEVVEVIGSAITVDTTSTAVAANLTDTFYQSVPVARGVTGLFYASPGVASGGGTGTANPSISGGTGLENMYVADGVNITDGSFGGIGVYSRNYGSLATGINLSFVKEVQVKTGGFEAQYGKSTGGIVQIVTKSGGDAFHGSIGGYFAPQAFEADRRFTDDFQNNTTSERFNLQGKIQHQSNYDVDVEAGGYVPKFKNKLFFFGSFNPQWNSDSARFAAFRNPLDTQTAGVATLGGTATGDPLGNVDISQRVYSYAGKLTWKVNDQHQFESSVFGDPTYGHNDPHGNGGFATATPTTFDKLQFGTRNWVVRYNGVLNPSWLLNSSFNWGHNNLQDTPAAPDVYAITDLVQRTPCSAPSSFADCTSPDNILRGQSLRQGLGYFENTTGDNYGFNLDTTKSFHFLGGHSATFGYRYERNHYDGRKDRTGASVFMPDLGVAAYGITGSNAAQIYSLLLANPTNASFQLRASAGNCGTAEIFVPGISNCLDGGEGVVLRQTRGEFGARDFKTKNMYNSIFGQDSWSINKYLTINAGLRWEQLKTAGVNVAYTFTDNWSPRVGFSIDPWGNRKTKIYASFGRYGENLPLDAAIRSLSNELDFSTTLWTPPNDGAGHVLENANGQINPVLDAAHFQGIITGVQASLAEPFAPGTRMEYLDEYVLGFEHEFGNSGVIFSARYTDRRIKRIIEDLSAGSPEAGQAGLSTLFMLGNPSKSLDVFTNPNQADYSTVCPFASPLVDTGAGGVTDSNGNSVTNTAGNTGACIAAGPYANGAQPGDPVADGVPDGFADPSRIYKSMEFEVNKSFSKNWQLRANYRIAKLFGNYEGSFNNSSGQQDPNISELFDFTQGTFNLLGNQFQAGPLPTDVRHLVNGYVSYTFGNKWMKGLTMGTSVHFQTGLPITNFFAHPVDQDSGELPVCPDGSTNSCPVARGALGRTHNWGQVDFHADYPIRLTERTKIRLAADLFNVTDQREILRLDQNAQRTVGVPNADFLKPNGIGPSAVTGNSNPGYQRPFYARFGVRFEF